MKVAIVGSRSVKDKDKVFSHISRILSSLSPPVVIISGGAKGVDSLAEKYAKEKGLDFILFEPYHLLDRKTEYSSKYFFVRNKQIVSNCDMLIAFWDGKSKGAEHAIHSAQSLNKEVIIVKC